MQQTTFTSEQILANSAAASAAAFSDYFVQHPVTQRLPRALDDLRAGRAVLLMDDADRENEADLIVSAEKLNTDMMARLIRDCSGIVCLCLTTEKIRALELPMMVEDNQSRYGTAFTVTIEAKHGVTTGVSAKDRVTTIQAAIHPQAKPEDLARPGHVFPLRAMPGGVLQRRGHTEGTIDLMRLAGLQPAGVLCELMNPDGSMAAGNPNPSHVYGDSGTYQIQLIVTGAGGCPDTVYGTVRVEPEFSIYIPNAFTPNGDGVNDGFIAYGKNIVSYEMWILDRWGMEIYHATDFHHPWDGTYYGNDKPCQNDVYEYVIDVTDQNLRRRRYIGHVTLVR